MGFLNLNLYGHLSGAVFDARKVIAKAREWFPEAAFDPADQAAEEVRRAEEMLAEERRTHPDGPASKVVASLRRKAQSYGPSYAFTIPRGEGPPILGLARSVGVEFLFDDPLSDETRRRLTAFLTTLGMGRLEASTSDPQRSEVLADLYGPSDCVRDRPGVPWKGLRSQPAGASEAP